MLRSVGAVLAGIGAQYLVGLAGSPIVMALVEPIGWTSYAPLDSPPEPPLVQISPSHLVALGALSIIGGIVAGWLTARLAPSRPMVHAIAMFGVPAATTILQFVFAGVRYSEGSEAVLVLTALAGVVVGAYLATLQSPRTT